MEQYTYRHLVAAETQTSENRKNEKIVHRIKTVKIAIFTSTIKIVSNEGVRNNYELN